MKRTDILEALENAPEIKWTIDSNGHREYSPDSILIVRPDYPDCECGSSGFTSVALRYGSTGNLLAQVGWSRKWLKVTPKNIRVIVARVAEHCKRYTKPESPIAAHPCPK